MKPFENTTSKDQLIAKLPKKYYYLAYFLSKIKNWKPYNVLKYFLLNLVGRFIK